MKNRHYSVSIESDDPRYTPKEFIISSKQVRSWLLASFVLLVIFGYIFFVYLTMSFDKEKFKSLKSEHQNRIIEQEKVIVKLQEEKRNSILSKEDDLNKKLIFLNELNKSIKSISKYISISKESIEKKISLNKELRNIKKELDSKKNEIKKIKPLLELTRKQFQMVAKETRKEIDKSYIEKLPWQIIIGFLVSFIAGLISGILLKLIKMKTSILGDKKKKRNKQK